MSYKKSGISMSNKYELLTNYIKKNKLVYFLGILTVISCNIFQVYFANAMGHVVDFFSDKKSSYDFFLFYTKNRDISKMDMFYVVFFSILISRILLTLSRFGWRITLARQTHLVAGLMKNQIWERARYFKYHDLLDKYSKGVLMNAANSDVGQARFLFGFTLVGVIDMIFLGVFTLFCMFQINVKLTFISILFLLAMPIIVRKLSKKEMELYEIAQQSLSDFNDLSTQAVSTVKLQKLGQISKFWYKRLYDSANSYMFKRLDAQLTSLKYIPYTGSSSIISYLVLFSYGIYLNIQNEISVGEFVSMQGLIFLLQDPLMELGFIISEWKKSATSLNRLNDIYRNQDESYLTNDGHQVLKSDEDIFELKNVSFSYGENEILKDFNLHIKKNSRIGITGKIGSGKSTLIEILAGLQRETTGEILYCGHPFSYYNHLDLRSEIVCVHQKPFLFADTIKNNIQMDANLSDLEVWHILELAGLKDDVSKFEDGLSTYLGEWGINLSGGQKQRLTLARALAKKPRILLLDDGLSAVDTVTEELILNNLNSNLLETTIIWVAHRRSTLKYCNQIIDMDEVCQKNS